MAENLTFDTNAQSLEQWQNNLNFVNMMIAKLPPEIRQRVSDGYHTLGELYDHRIELFIALCRRQTDWNSSDFEPSKADQHIVWRSKFNSAGEGDPEWFLLGMDKKPGEQITYHLPISRWDECDFALAIPRAPKWDGHSSADVLTRLKNL